MPRNKFILPAIVLAALALAASIAAQLIDMDALTWATVLLAVLAMLTALASRGVVERNAAGGKGPGTIALLAAVASLALLWAPSVLERFNASENETEQPRQTRSSDEPAAPAPEGLDLAD